MSPPSISQLHLLCMPHCHHAHPSLHHFFGEQPRRTPRGHPLILLGSPSSLLGGSFQNASSVSFPRAALTDRVALKSVVSSSGGQKPKPRRQRALLPRKAAGVCGVCGQPSFACRCITLGSASVTPCASSPFVSSSYRDPSHNGSNAPAVVGPHLN